MTTTTSVPRALEAHRVLRVALWSAQVLLALAFLLAGVAKIFTPLEELRESWRWIVDTPALFVRLIGACEVSAAIALVLPAAARLRPLLTPVAATALALLMLCAFAFHVARGETHSLAAPVLLGALAAFVMWGRFRGAPITARVDGS